MSDYISRQAAIEAIENTPVKSIDAEKGLLILSGLGNACDIIEAIPAADVVPVIHARWNQLDNGGFVCSACMGGYKAQPTRMGKPMFEYCPICGAKMDGGDANG